jgi:hypothetical protein
MSLTAEQAWELGRDAVVGHLLWRAGAYRIYKNPATELAVKYLTEAAEYAKRITPPGTIGAQPNPVPSTEEKS